MIAQLPEAASIERTKAVVAEMREIAMDTLGVADVLEVSGYNIVGPEAALPGHGLRHSRFFASGRRRRPRPRARWAPQAGSP